MAAQIGSGPPVAVSTLDSLNVEQAREQNKAALNNLGGVEALATSLGVNIATGLTDKQVEAMREFYGTNDFPSSPMQSYCELLGAAFCDSTLLILIAAATVSLVIGIIEDQGEGWIEGGAIFIAVFLVANISAGNDYSKELQFRSLEASSANDERASVLRTGGIVRINPVDIVVGDILILQAGDSIPADCVVCDNERCLANESALTGEPDDIKKTKNGDPFLLSSCLITECDESRAIAIGIGMHSQWGKIKANLVTEAVNTPLQDKLEIMTAQIGYIGMFAAAATFIALIARINYAHQADILHGFIDAFILSVTIIVVAIPEGLPLAVTIALAYSTKKMYQDQNFIRVLAACETMGNATNICSDKTGTLTENRMTVVAGWFGNSKLSQEEFEKADLHQNVKELVAQQSCVSRTAYLVYKDAEGKDLHAPVIIGNKTEGALLLMSKGWGYDDEETRKKHFNHDTDKVFSFNSSKKRSSTVCHLPDKSIRIYCKGASEWVIKDCSHFTDKDGSPQPMTEEKRTDLEAYINSMADLALRTLCLTHKDLSSASDLPPDWMENNPPDNSGLCLDCIVGIIDPLRGDVKEAVKTAQAAGVTVRMVTGDNVATAAAIARQCGILTEGGLAIEGPNFRQMTPKDLDRILPHVQVMGRSSPDDKYLLVTRLNGHAVPDGKEEWELKHQDKIGVTWDKDRDLLLPGYREEWEATRPEGGQVVGVTGDGTNDAPALKAADVGLSMGITGTKVAQSASDIVILDDRFSSIVRAIMWGRSVYDNIRKFLQFQLTVNLVALLIVFIGALAGFGQPLNAVQMLWVNLVMDTMGALALATEPPTLELLNRKPYKRSTALISAPMWRNIICQSIFQLAVLLFLLFAGAEMFDVPEGIYCKSYKVHSSKSNQWTYAGAEVSSGGDLTCASFTDPQYNCGGTNNDCLDRAQSNGGTDWHFGGLDNFESTCLTCKSEGYLHGTLIFNTFIWCQIFNEYTARSIFDEWNFLAGIENNYVFLLVSIFTVGAQVFLVEVGGDFVKTTPLDFEQWMITIGIGALSLLVGIAMRFIPVEEHADDFFDNQAIGKKIDEQEGVEMKQLA